MKKYILPLLMHVSACGADEEIVQPTIPHTPVEQTAATPQIGNVPDLQNPALRELYPGFGEPVMVRDLNSREVREAKAVISRAQFLTPYAVELTQNSVLAKPQEELGGQSLSSLYTYFTDQAAQAVHNGTFLIEPSLSDQTADGMYRPLTVEETRQEIDGTSSKRIIEKRVNYTFGDDLHTWGVGVVVHEIAHNTFPSKHDLGIVIPPSSKGQHVVEHNDQVYGVSDVYSVLDAPLVFVRETIHSARTGQADPKKTLLDLTLIQTAPDEEWTRMFVEGVYTSYQGFLPVVGISQAELEAVYANSQYREYYREQIKEAVNEFSAEMQLSEAELSELQTQHQIDASSDEFWHAMYITVSYSFDGKKNLELEAENERKRNEYFKQIDRVNAAVRKTRDWR